MPQIVLDHSDRTENKTNKNPCSNGADILMRKDNKYCETNRI